MQSASARQARYYPPDLLLSLRDTLRDLFDARSALDYEAESLTRSPLPPAAKAMLAQALVKRRRQTLGPLEQRLRDLEQDMRSLCRDRGWPLAS